MKATVPEDFLSIGDEVVLSPKYYQPMYLMLHPELEAVSCVQLGKISKVTASSIVFRPISGKSGAIARTAPMAVFRPCRQTFIYQYITLQTLRNCMENMKKFLFPTKLITNSLQKDDE